MTSEETKTMIILRVGKGRENELQGLKARLTFDLDSGGKSSKYPTVEIILKVLQ